MEKEKASSTLTDLLPSTEVEQPGPENLPYLPPQGGNMDMLMDERLFALGQRAAKLFAASDMVPAKYHNNMANCFVAIHLARNLDVDPFMFMKNCYFVGNEPELEGKLVIALINTRGPYPNGVEWKKEGNIESDDYTVTAFGRRANGDIDYSSPLSIKKVKEIGWYSKNPWWRNLTDQMLMYRTATMLARVHCPQVLMGLKTAGEVTDSGGPAMTVMGARELNEELGLKKAKPISVEPILEEDANNDVGKSS